MSIICLMTARDGKESVAEAVFEGDYLLKGLPGWLSRRKATAMQETQETQVQSLGVGCHALLQRIFHTQGLNLSLLCLLHCSGFSSAEPPWKPF